MTAIERCGDPLYDPYALHWSSLKQRHMWPDAMKNAANECDPKTCEGCQAAAKGEIRPDEMKRLEVAKQLWEEREYRCRNQLIRGSSPSMIAASVAVTKTQARWEAVAMRLWPRCATWG